MLQSTYAVYKPAALYFDLVRRALGNLVDGEHFFDTVADDIVYEVRCDIPGWPRVVNGRSDLMAAFRGHVENMTLRAVDGLIVHKTDDNHVIIIEYEVQGTMLESGVRYDNRFCSIIKLERRRVVHLRDYMDSLAAWNALTAQGR